MWRRFASYFTGSFAAVIFAVALLVLLADPYGNSPIGLPVREPILDTNQRYVYPQILKYGSFDSFVIGTSTSRLLEPERLNRAFNANFANLAMNDGRAWEQYQLMKLVLRFTPSPKILFIGIDTVWCREDANIYRVSKTRDFPYWMYDENPYNDLLHLFNTEALKHSLEKIGYHLGRKTDQLAPNGYGDFTKGEKHYDLERARQRIAESIGNLQPQHPAFSPPSDPNTYWHLPALTWLDEILSQTDRTTHVMLVTMPVHVTAQPQPGSRLEAQERECKRRLEEIAARHGAYYADYRTPSAITTNDANYWDPLHWRIHIGRQLIDELGAHVATIATP